MREKPKPVLKRNGHNQIIDPTEAKRITEDLVKKLVHEQRLHEKDESLHTARTGRRDVVVHLSVTILPAIDGHPIIGEQEREYNQWCFKLPATKLPVTNATAIQAFSELCHIGKQALMKLGMVRP